MPSNHGDDPNAANAKNSSEESHPNPAKCATAPADADGDGRFEASSVLPTLSKTNIPKATGIQRSEATEPDVGASDAATTCKIPTPNQSPSSCKFKVSVVYEGSSSSSPAAETFSPRSIIKKTLHGSNDPERRVRFPNEEAELARRYSPELLEEDRGGLNGESTIAAQHVYHGAPGDDGQVRARVFDPWRCHGESASFGKCMRPLLIPQFEQPVYTAHFPAKLENGKISLEIAFGAPGSSVYGSVAVANFEPVKEILVYYTHNGWFTKQRVAASFLEHVHATNTDRFSFRLEKLCTFEGHKCVVQLYVEYRTLSRGVHYDNNFGKNYALHKHWVEAKDFESGTENMTHLGSNEDEREPCNHNKSFNGGNVDSASGTNKSSSNQSNGNGHASEMEASKEDEACELSSDDSAYSTMSRRRLASIIEERSDGSSSTDSMHANAGGEETDSRASSASSSLSDWTEYCESPPCSNNSPVCMAKQDFGTDYKTTAALWEASSKLKIMKNLTEMGIVEIPFKVTPKRTRIDWVTAKGLVSKPQ